MLGNGLIRLAGAGVLVLIITATSLATAPVVAHGDKGNVLCAGIPDSVGMVIDTHQNLYMAARNTGNVFYVPHGGAPVLLAKVPGTPTALTVDHQRTVFVSTQNGTIYRVGLDGSVDEAYCCPAHPIGLSIDRDGSLIIASKDGVIRKLSRSELNAAQ